MTAPRKAPSAATVRALTGGALLSASLFVAAAALAASGRPWSSGPVLGPVAAARGMLELDPAAWASAGILVLLASPVLGLLTTAAEYRRVDIRYSALACLVLAILTGSLLLAILR